MQWKMQINKHNKHVHTYTHTCVDHVNISGSITFRACSAHLASQVYKDERKNNNIYI